jgi:S-adenosylmethionine hydrolase
MHDALVTLTTDFGDDSPYVAAMKGVLLGINPRARLVDLSHRIPPQNLRHVAFFLQAAIPYFPPGVIHVVVVDPGVGSARALLYVEVQGHRLLVPDNGCWTELARGATQPPSVFRLSEPRYWRHPVSATFHGRDILAPVAGHLSLGVAPQALGKPARTWVELDLPRPTLQLDRLIGEVVCVDHFGNLITNIPGDALAAWANGCPRITVGEHEIERRVRTYADAEPGTLVVLVSSTGTLEVAVNQGNAAAQLHATVGTPVRVTLAGAAPPGGHAGESIQAVEEDPPNPPTAGPIVS